eukprot:1754903-Rhodomonas_salina.1
MALYPMPVPHQYQRARRLCSAVSYVSTGQRHAGLGSPFCRIPPYPLSVPRYNHTLCQYHATTIPAVSTTLQPYPLPVPRYNHIPSVSTTPVQQHTLAQYCSRGVGRSGGDLHDRRSS